MSDARFEVDIETDAALEFGVVGLPSGGKLRINSGRSIAVSSR
jgi:hypothetical protein